MSYLVMGLLILWPIVLAVSLRFGRVANRELNAIIDELRQDVSLCQLAEYRAKVEHITALSHLKLEDSNHYAMCRKLLDGWAPLLRNTNYLERIVEFPLEPIRDDAHSEAAMAVMDKLLRQPELSEGDQAYYTSLEVLMDWYDKHLNEHRERTRYASASVLEALQQQAQKLTDALGQLRPAPEISEPPIPTRTTHADVDVSGSEAGR